MSERQQELHLLRILLSQQKELAVKLGLTDIVQYIDAALMRIPVE